jgi:glycerol-3-phosphate dehydrogenase
MPADKFQTGAAVLIPSLGEPRFLFVIPWLGRIIIGTTDSDYSGDLDEPRPEENEIERLIESAARYFPQSHVSRQDLISSFAGLRPLVAAGNKPTADLSRREEIIESRSGLISIVGGKLTTYRRMAGRVVNLAISRLGLPQREPHPVELAGPMIPNLRDCASRAAADFGVPAETAEHLCQTYGGNHRAVLEIALLEGLTSTLVEELPHIEAEVVYAARHEMAATAEDVLRRRTPIALLARDRGSSSKDRVAHLMCRELGGLLPPTNFGV